MKKLKITEGRITSGLNGIGEDGRLKRPDKEVKLISFDLEIGGVRKMVFWDILNDKVIVI